MLDTAKHLDTEGLGDTADEQLSNEVRMYVLRSSAI